MLLVSLLLPLLLPPAVCDGGGWHVLGEDEDGRGAREVGVQRVVQRADAQWRPI